MEIIRFEYVKLEIIEVIYCLCSRFAQHKIMDNLDMLYVNCRLYCVYFVILLPRRIYQYRKCLNY